MGRRAKRKILSPRRRALDAVLRSIHGHRRGPEPGRTLARYSQGRCLIQLRQETPALAADSYHSVNVEAGGILAYVRKHGEQRTLAVFNFGSDATSLHLTPISPGGEILCSTHLDRDGEAGLQELGVRPGEGLLISLSPAA